MPIIKDRFGDKVKTNKITNEIKEIKQWIEDKQKAEGKHYEVIPRDHTITTLHRKGQWINPNRISILNAPKIKNEFDYDWNNREQLPALDQQRVQLDRLMKHPEQEIRFRTQKHAEKDMKLYTPRVFRNEGGNLMSSIAGAGCNKFHEFRQIRRNDKDREKFFEYLREKEIREKKLKAEFKAFQDANARKLMRNRKRFKEANNINKNKGRAKALKLAAQNMSRNKNLAMMKRKGRGSRNVSGDSDIQVIEEREDTSGDPSEVQSSSKLVEEEIAEVEEQPVEDSYDPDDSYDEDEDDGLPPVELRQKLKQLN